MPDRDRPVRMPALRESPALDPAAFKSLEVKTRLDNMQDLQKEIAKSRILESALAELQRSPGFDPEVAISIVFGLKW